MIKLYFDLIRTGDANAWRRGEVYIDEAVDLAEVDSLKGVPVFTPSGRRLGALEGIVIDKRSGSISYVVLCRSRFLGLRRERHMLPRAALTARIEQDGFTVDLDWKTKAQAVSRPSLLVLRNASILHAPSSPSSPAPLLTRPRPRIPGATPRMTHKAATRRR